MTPVVRKQEIFEKPVSKMLFSTILGVCARIRCRFYTLSHSIAIQGKRDVLNHHAREFPLDELKVLIRFYTFHCLLL